MGEEEKQGLALWLSEIILHWQLCHSIGMQICIPAVSFPIQIPAYILERLLRMAQALGSLYSLGRPGSSSRLLASDRLSSNHHDHFWSEPVDGSTLSCSLSFPFSVNLLFKQKLKKNTRLKRKKTEQTF